MMVAALVLGIATIYFIGLAPDLACALLVFCIICTVVGTAFLLAR